jgi:hypothetical protein
MVLMEKQKNFGVLMTEGRERWSSTALVFSKENQKEV